MTSCWPSIGRALAQGENARPILVLAAVLSTLGAILAGLGGAGALLFDDIQELVAAGGGAVALAWTSRRLEGARRRLVVALAMSLGGAWLGMLAWDLSDWVGAWLARGGDIVFVASACLGVAAIGQAIFDGIQSDRLVSVAIDALILCLAGIAVVAALWSTSVVAPGDRTASLGAVILIATSAGAAFGLIERRVIHRTSSEPRVEGIARPGLSPDEPAIHAISSAWQKPSPRTARWRT